MINLEKKWRDYFYWNTPAFGAPSLLYFFQIQCLRDLSINGDPWEFIKLVWVNAD